MKYNFDDTFDETQEIIVDADIFLNNWHTPFIAGGKKIRGLKSMEDTRLYLSLSNWHYTKMLLAKTLELIENTQINLKEPWEFDHRTILALLRSSEVNKMVFDFSKDTTTYSRGIKLNKVGLEIVIYKGYNIDMSSVTNGDDLSPTIEEVVAFANYKRQQGVDIPILVGNKLIQSFAFDYNIDVPILNAR